MSRGVVEREWVWGLNFIPTHTTARAKGDFIDANQRMLIFE